MADWRLDVCDHAVHGVHLVGGDPPLIAVWLTARSVQFYDVHHGALYGTLNVMPAPDGDPGSGPWRSFVNTLRAPNGSFLPVVEAGHAAVHTSRDGRVHLFHRRDGGLTLGIDGDLFVLEHGGDPIVAAALDRELATVGGWGADNRLHVFQQHVYLGAYDIDAPSDGAVPLVLLPDAAGIVIIVLAGTLLACDTAGQVQARQHLPFATGAASCSPDGGLIALVDRGQGMIRVYDAGLQLTHQHPALDVVEKAAPLQLLVGLPALDAVPEALRIDDDGTLVFAVDGIVCRTHVNALTPLPQPRSLL